MFTVVSSNLLNFAVLGVFQGSFCFPVLLTAKLNALDIFLNLWTFLLHVATTEDRGLQVLVLSLFVVEPVPQNSVISLNGFHPRIAPVDILCHQSSILPVFIVSSENFSSLAMKLTVNLVFAAWTVHFFGARGDSLFDLCVVRAAHVVEPVLAEKDIGALAFTTEFFSVDCVGCRRPEDR